MGRGCARRLDVWRGEDWNWGAALTGGRRDRSNNTNFQHQWIVLDGDIDAEWIESMNTVMDDNKMLTLASNERIPLSASMRLLLEINHMVHCSPATVSRGGVIYLNADDIGWSPVVESWIQGREDKAFRPLLTELFDKRAPPAARPACPSCRAGFPAPARQCSSGAARCWRR